MVPAECTIFGALHVEAGSDAAIMRAYFGKDVDHTVLRMLLAERGALAELDVEARHRHAAIV